MGMSEKNSQGIYVAWDNPNSVFPGNDFNMTDENLEAMLTTFWQIFPGRSGFVFRYAEDLFRRRHGLAPVRMRLMARHSRARVCDDSKILCEACVKATSVANRSEAIAARKFLVERQENPCKDCLALANTRPARALAHLAPREDSLSVADPDHPAAPVQVEPPTGADRLPIRWINPNAAHPLNGLGLDSAFLDRFLADYWDVSMVKRAPKFRVNIPVIRQFFDISAALEKQILDMSYAWIVEDLPRCAECHQALRFKTRSEFVNKGMPMLLDAKKHCPACTEMQRELAAQNVDFSTVEYKPSAKPSLATASPGAHGGVLDEIRAGMRNLPQKARTTPLTSEEAILVLADDILTMFDKGYSFEDILVFLESHGVIAPEGALAVILLSHKLKGQEPVSEPVPLVAETRGQGSLSMLLAPTDHSSVTSEIACAAESRTAFPADQFIDLGLRLAAPAEVPAQVADPDVKVVKGYAKRAEQSVQLDSDPSAQGFLTNREAAKYMGIPMGTLSTWRFNKKGPVYHKFDGRVWYAKVDLDEYKRVNLVFADSKSRSSARPSI